MDLASLPPHGQTFTYKQVLFSAGSLDIQLDVYPPTFTPTNHAAKAQIPVVIYFHGGGLCIGNRQIWFPTWLHDRATKAGYAFISADYRLLPASTGHDVIEDVRDVLRFSVSREFNFPESFGSFLVNPDAIAVTGSSAGGLCAYLTAMHCTSPKPKVIVSTYGMAGDLFVNYIKISQYLHVKTKPFLFGIPIQDPRTFTELLHQKDDPTSVSADSKSWQLKPISDAPIILGPEGIPTGPRSLILVLYLQLGIWIDYYTGAHANGGISAALREALDSQSQHALDDLDLDDARVDAIIRKVVPQEHHKLFPSLGASSTDTDVPWPPTFLIHGASDSAVPALESRSMLRRLKRRGVDVQHFEAEGKEHGFDNDPTAEEEFGFAIFDKVGEFLKKHLGA
ncbi:hypothetical protein H0H92_010278 [Tricholoma furcatifolium]|nr:hypothetical protein H0H92_010278 [Tricholoma furcatifolium]